jgi:hypothetical protein
VRSWLGKIGLIQVDQVQKVLERTINFLRPLVKISPPLQVDLIILENASKVVNGSAYEATDLALASEGGAAAIGMTANRSFGA